MNAKFIVYYKNIPQEITNYAASDRSVTVLKDGVNSLDGQRFPRLTIYIEHNGSQEDLKKIKNFWDLLNNLKSSNQILSCLRR